MGALISTDHEGEHRGARVPHTLMKLLRDWRTLIARPTWRKHNDCAWWYGERAAVSQLAGAAWLQRDAWAMQEYAWTRGGDEGESHARIDLCIELRSLRIVVEAKQVWPNMESQPKTIERAIRSAFDEAEDQLARVKPHGYRHVPLVFVSPRIEHSSTFEERLPVLLDAVRTQRAAAVWTFPRWARQLRSDVTALCYPGAIAIAKCDG